jgi:hypothetical protein
MPLRVLTLALSVVTAACQGASPTADGPCPCAPGNRSRARQPDGTPFDSAALLAGLRRHRRAVAERRPARDVKLLDDELRLAVASFCQPCGAWVGDRLTIDQLFPLARLDDAVAGVCLGLVLGDGTTAYGDARPAACR